MENKTFKVNKDKCIGCGSCTIACPEGSEMDTDGKAKIISSAKVEECGGEELCPYGAIEEVNGAGADEERE
jgi:NADH-quinone oxidoreductase subunit F